MTRNTSSLHEYTIILPIVTVQLVMGLLYSILWVIWERLEVFIEREIATMKRERKRIVKGRVKNIENSRMQENVNIKMYHLARNS